MNDTLFKEVVGIIGSILVVISMMFKTTTDKGVLLLRIFNLMGSIVFVVYGVLLPAYSTVVLNLICVVLNTIGIVSIANKIRSSKKDKLTQENTDD